jgi:hypothetical protein
MHNQILALELLELDELFVNFSLQILRNGNGYKPPDTGLAPGPAGYRHLAPVSADHKVLSRACSPIITSLDLATAAKGHQRIR